MKGTDGGLWISPHSAKRFPGHTPETLPHSTPVHKEHIGPAHADYMREMEEDDEENYQEALLPILQRTLRLMTLRS
jgi:hypothetical protein